MTVVPMLGDWEVPRIAMMRSEEARKFAEFPVPGRRGSLFQDLDAEAAVIDIAGSLYAEEETGAFMQAARSRFAAGEPLTFVADITEATDIQYVLIEHLVLEMRGDRPGELGYRLRLRESPPPPPPPDPFGGIAGDLLAEAGALVEGVTSALDALDALADLPDFSDPSALLGGTTEEAAAAIGRLGEIGGKLQALFGGS